MKRFLYATFLSTIFTINLSHGYSKKLTAIVDKIAKINEVQGEYIGFAGVESENYSNFKQLQKVATTEELVRLTENENAAVACYAGWALVDKAYPDLKTILQKFIQQNRQVETLDGCIGSQSDIASELYHRYWNSVDLSKRAADKTLLQLDSVVLFSKSANWLLLVRAMENRVYTAPFKVQIAVLAFEQERREAIFYLCKWYRAEYIDKIKPALVNYLNKTNFKRTGTTDYYKTIQELFQFNDTEIKKAIIAKMQQDRHWELQKERFSYLLRDNYVFNIDSE
ncbi:MAG TPA: hypothetical protein VL092_04650 [Chitinophagaceae bacterium]|nr:hypothetical protein [Chitinophagaceae bacterium]